MTTMVQKETYRRGPFGQFAKWTFIGFNLLMAFWLVRAILAVSGYQPYSELEQVGFAIGVTIGFTLLFAIWGIVGLILAILVLATRGDRVVTEQPAGATRSFLFWRNAEEPDDAGAKADAIVARYLAQQNAQQAASATARAAMPAMPGGASLRAPPPRGPAAASFGKRKR
jgi:hypothetical protein